LAINIQSNEIFTAPSLNFIFYSVVITPTIERFKRSSPLLAESLTYWNMTASKNGDRD
jgi:hypothetical protein